MREKNFNQFIQALERHDCSGKANNPVQLMLGLTNVCNLHCAFYPYCGFCMQKIEAVEEIPAELLENLRPYIADVKFLNPSGRGEPLLYRDFVSFMRICRETSGLEALHLTNNGTQLHRIDMDVLEGTNIVAISIDSVDRETFEMLRFGAKLDLVLENVAKLRKRYPDMMIQWSVVVNRLNIDQLYDIFVKARQMGINYITFNDVYGYEEDKTIQLLRLRTSDYPIIEEQFSWIKAENQGTLAINNVIAYDGFEDGAVLDRRAVIDELRVIQKQQPYLDYDEINCEDIESRKIKLKERGKDKLEGMRLPYCTCPFSVMFIQPNCNVSPCCSSYGTIGTIENNDVDGVWKGENYRLLREAMFDYDMLPDYCRQCTSFVRYDYINEFLEELQKQPGFDMDSVTIPPNFQPMAGTVKSDIWKQKFEEEDRRAEYLAELVCRLLPEWLLEQIKNGSASVLSLNQTRKAVIKRYEDAFGGISVASASGASIASDGQYCVALNMEGEKRRLETVIEECCRHSKKYAVILFPYKKDDTEYKMAERITTSDIPLISRGIFFLTQKQPIAGRNITFMTKYC